MKQGLKENWKQFSLLVLINAFVGGMVGLERSILPELAEKEFNIASNSAIISFIIFFGITKALTNYYMGRFANKIGRKKLLIIGWLFALPVPFILMFAQNWALIIFANILLGINQGLAWSSTIVMKIDLVGNKNRGVAMGFNEFAGYFAVAVTSFLSGYIADQYGLRPYPFVLGVIISILGLILSIFFVKDTAEFVLAEAKKSDVKKNDKLFWLVTLKDKVLSSITQAGLINNLNDGMLWGLLPLLLFNKGFDLETIAIIVSIYPAVWGIGQLFTGPLGDYFPKRIIVIGMLLQGLAIIGLAFADSFLLYATLSFLLGIGTALVYPTFFVMIAKFTHPEERAEAIGIFRLWRDLGYAIGALLTGIIADIWDVETAITFVGVLTLISGIIVKLRVPEGKRTPKEVLT